MSSPELTPPTSEDELLRRYAEGDVSAREELARRYMPLARRLAGRYRHTGEAQDDLEQVAYLGLLKANHRYDAGTRPVRRATRCPTSWASSSATSATRAGRCTCPRSVQERVLAGQPGRRHAWPGGSGRSPTAARPGRAHGPDARGGAGGAGCRQRLHARRRWTRPSRAATARASATLGDTLGGDDARLRAGRARRGHRAGASRRSPSASR